VKYNELYDIISQRVPHGLSLSWDNDGKMLCLDSEKSIKKVLVCLDVTMGAIEYAGKNGFDLIVSHHPLIFKPLCSLNADSISGKRLLRLMSYGLSVMSFHTRLDATHVNSALAECLELQEITEFFVEGSPMGRVGRLKCEMTLGELALYIKEKLGGGAVEYPDIDCRIKNVAVLGGSGGDAIYDAIEAGADCLVTGECGYNKSLDSAELGFPVITAGHFHTENPVCREIEYIIKTIDGDIQCEIYTSNIFKAI